MPRWPIARNRRCMAARRPFRDVAQTSAVARAPRGDSSADRDIRLGLWKIHILHHAATREVWGLWLLEELAVHGHKLSPGTLYPALARMERNGWLARTGDASHARARRMLHITPAGWRVLHELRRDVRELYEEVVVGPTRHRRGRRGEPSS